MKKYERLKIGVVGCGYWATNLIKTFEDNNIKNVTIFDNKYSQVKLIKKKFNFVKIGKSFENLINLNLDCIFLITPSSTHFKLARKIINKGHNLFLEKPGTLSSKHFGVLTDLSQKKKITFMVGYIYNFNVYINYIKKILKKNVLGKIKYLYFERSNLGPIRNDTSCVWDLASHDISTSYFLLNTNPKIEIATGNNFLKKKYYDISFIKMNFSGIKVEIKSSWLNPEKIRKLIIIGEKKMLQFDEMAKKDKINIYNKYATYPKISKFKKNFFSPHANIYLGSTFVPKIKYKPPMLNEIEHFFSAIKNKKKPSTDGQYAKKIIKILESIDDKFN